MRGTRQLVAASAFGLALLAPALPIAAQEGTGDGAPGAAPPSLTPSNVSPDASVTAAERDGLIAFDASRSSDADGRIVAYAWDLDGDGVYETDTGAQPTVERRYPPGTALVAAVRVTDDAGATGVATATVAVQNAPERAPLVPTRELAAGDPAATANDPAPAPAAKAEPTVRAAASRSVTIRDFQFVPATVNIGVGDTVTWTNQGPTEHTATANDGSFDSGLLAKGKSYSKTFSSAGTFSYICQPHPFMTGKVVVASGGGGSGSGSGSGSGTGTGTGTGSGAGTGTAGGSPSGATSGGLAKTGVDLIAWSVFGFALLAFGAALRWRLMVD